MKWLNSDWVKVVEVLLLVILASFVFALLYKDPNRGISMIALFVLIFYGAFCFLHVMPRFIELASPDQRDDP